MLNAIDHIAIAVRSLTSAVPRYERALGARCAQFETIERQGVRAAFFEFGGTRLELLEPTSPQSPVARFLEKHGEGVHHLAFRSTGFPADLQRAVDAGCEHLSTVPAEGAGGSQVAFLHPRDLCGVLVEICGREDAGKTS
jgi:methylmalonyl-CoA/ethylmalonyl-CoA epimerase